MARRNKKSEVGSAVQKEITDACPKIRQKSGEDEQKWFLRLVKALAKLKDKEFEALSEEAQDWYDAAAEAANDGDAIPDFPEGEEEEEEADDDDEEEGDDDDEEEGDGGIEFSDLEEGMVVTIEDDEGELSGTVVKLMKKYVVIEDDEEEETKFIARKIVSITDDTEYEDEDEDEDEEEDEDEDEEEDDGADAGEEGSLELDDLKKGQIVTAQTEDDEYTGKVTGLSHGKLRMICDGERVQLNEEDITWIEAAEAVEAEEEEAPALKGPDAIRQLVSEFAGSKVETIEKKASKAGIKISERNLAKVFKDSHTLIDMLVEAGWTKPAK